MNDDMKKFKLQIHIYTLVAAVVFGVGSIPFLGLNTHYFYGLISGVCISIVSFNVLLFVSEMVLNTGNKYMAALGYLIRLPLYGLDFYMCLRIGVVAGIACVIGFMAAPASMVYVHGIKAKYSAGRKVRPEVLAEYEEEDRRNARSEQHWPEDNTIL